MDEVERVYKELNKMKETDFENYGKLTRETSVFEDKWLDLVKRVSDERSEKLAVMRKGILS